MHSLLPSKAVYVSLWVSWSNCGDPRDARLPLDRKLTLSSWKCYRVYPITTWGNRSQARSVVRLLIQWAPTAPTHPRLIGHIYTALFSHVYRASTLHMLHLSVRVEHEWWTWDWLSSLWRGLSWTTQRASYSDWVASASSSHWLECSQLGVKVSCFGDCSWTWYWVKLSVTAEYPYKCIVLRFPKLALYTARLKANCNYWNWFHEKDNFAQCRSICDGHIVRH